MIIYLLTNNMKKVSDGIYFLLIIVSEYAYYNYFQYICDNCMRSFVIFIFIFYLFSFLTLSAYYLNYFVI